MAQPKHRSVIVEDAAPGHASLPASNLDDEIVEQLSDRFTFRRPTEVMKYLNEHPHLAPLLLEASDVIPQYFGTDAPLVLEVFTDPESEADDRMLFALVQTTLGAKEGLDRLFQLDEEWWLAKSPDGPGALVVDIEQAP